MSHLGRLVVAAATLTRVLSAPGVLAGQGDSAAAVVKDGLSIAAAPAKPRFAERERLAFTIAYKNVGDKDIWLFNPALGFSDGPGFARVGTFTVTGTASGQQWRLVCSAEITRADRFGWGAVHLKAGQSYATTFTTAHLHFAPAGEHSKAPQFLRPGKYRFQAELVFGRPEAEDRSHQYWTGPIKLHPIEFEVGGRAEDEALVITEKANGTTVNALVGQTIEVRLEGERAMTGWEASAVAGDAVERVGAQPGERNVSASPAFTPKPGAADKAIGTYAFRYKAVKPGQARLRFVYVYPGGPVPMPRLATALVKEFITTVKVGVVAQE